MSGSPAAGWSSRFSPRCSNSSKKTTACSRLKSRCSRAESSATMDRSTSMKAHCSRPAMALRSAVLPVPGGSKRRMALTRVTPCFRARSCSCRGRTTRRSITLLSSVMVPARPRHGPRPAWGPDRAAGQARQTFVVAWDSVPRQPLAMKRASKLDLKCGSLSGRRNIFLSLRGTPSGRRFQYPHGRTGAPRSV